MKNTPKRIYLQVDPKNEKPEDFNELTEVTWCQDKIFDTDICYIRAGKKIDKKLDDILCCFEHAEEKLSQIINREHIPANIPNVLNYIMGSLQQGIQKLKMIGE